MTTNKVILAGGGTGGHIMPAIALATELKSRGFEVLFVGSKNRMEANLVPKFNFPIRFIWISAFHRDFRLSNLIFPLKVLISIVQSLKIVLSYKPHFLIGTGGFASGPILWTAAKLNRKIFIQEQNSYPGITTRMLAKHASLIFTSYARVNDFIKTSLIREFGNPIRKLSIKKGDRLQLLNSFGLKDQLTISIIGGSQGSLSINNAFRQVLVNMPGLTDVNIIWQAGQLTLNEFKIHENEHIKVIDFIDNIDDVYSLSDIIICRAGAITLSEISHVECAPIIIPLKSAAANHQYHNAFAFQEKDAAILLNDDATLSNELQQTIEMLIKDENKRQEMAKNLKKMAFENSTEKIIEEILKEVEN